MKNWVLTLYASEKESGYPFIDDTFLLKRKPTVAKLLEKGIPLIYVNKVMEFNSCNIGQSTRNVKEVMLWANLEQIEVE